MWNSNALHAVVGVLKKNKRTNTFVECTILEIWDKSYLANGHYEIRIFALKY